MAINYESKFNEAVNRLHKAPDRTLRIAANFLVSEIRKATPKSNSPYKRYLRTTYGVGKEKGEVIGRYRIKKGGTGYIIQTKPGSLRRSIRYQYVKSRNMVKIGVPKWYINMVERNTTRRIGTPFFMKTVERCKPEMQEIISLGIKELMERG